MRTRATLCGACSWGACSPAVSFGHLEESAADEEVVRGGVDAADHEVVGHHADVAVRDALRCLTSGESRLGRG